MDAVCAIIYAAPHTELKGRFVTDDLSCLVND